MVVIDGNTEHVKQIIVSNICSDDCTITSPVSDHDFMDADMTNPDSDIVPVISFDITTWDIVIPEAHKEPSILDDPSSFITSDEVEPLTFDIVKGGTKRCKPMLV